MAKGKTILEKMLDGKKNSNNSEIDALAQMLLEMLENPKERELFAHRIRNARQFNATPPAGYTGPPKQPRLPWAM